MGDSGNNDTSSTAEDFIDSTEVDQPTQDQNRSNIVGSDSYDAQFTADNLEARGLPPENFMSAANFAQTRQGGAGGDDTTSTPEDFIDSTGISVPSIQTASSTLAPGILGETLSDFQSGVRPITGEEDTPANQMLEAAVASRPRDFSDLDLIPTTGFLPAQVTRSDVTSPASAAIANVISDKMNQNVARRFGLGDPRGIDFGVTQQLLPAQEIDDLADTEFATPRGVTRATNELDLADQDFPTVDTRTTATGTNLPEDYEENVGRAFPVETLERVERLVNEKTALENLGLPSFLTAVDPGRITRDLMATSLIAGRPISAVEGIRGVQAPNIGMGMTEATDKETIEEYNKRTGARIPESQIITDNSGLVVGIKDAQGNLITGMDPNAREEQGDGGEQVTKAPPKAPTDPCPDGYQLIDGKCTPTGATDTGTGFMMFPADRDPAFRRGPFTPTTVATNPNIQALNPVTFGLSNIFRR